MQISHQKLKELITYNPETGMVSWKVSPSRNIKLGERAGYFCKSKKKTYRSITILGERRREHCWAWFYITGSLPINEIDHINGDGTDNRWCNLRHVTSSENRHNQRMLCNNKSGINGVFWSNSKKSWVVTFVIEGKQRTIMQTKDFFEACCTRKSLDRAHNYSLQHGTTRPY